MIPIYTFKSDKSLGSDRGQKTSTQKVKDPLSFEIWIFLNGQIVMTTVDLCSDDFNQFRFCFLGWIFVPVASKT